MSPVHRHSCPLTHASAPTSSGSASPSAGRRWRPSSRLLLFPQSIALPLDVDGSRVMEQPVEDRGGEDLVVEDLAPVDEALVAGDDEAGPFVASDEEAEEQARLLAGQRQVAELVQDQHARIGELLQGPLESVLVAGTDQAPHQALEGEE